MHVISTGRETVLSDFADLESKSTYQHFNDESTDFQFYLRQRIFVEVNKKSGLEILRIKEKQENNLEIQRVRKLNIENACAVACTKQSLEDIAFGLSNGHVKLYNYKNTSFVHRFKSENTRHGVLFLDYNISDEYLSSVSESGQIYIYGIKTKTKIDSVFIDGNSTLARFHPIKRLQLCVASYKGAVTIYDVQSKKKLFHSIDSHGAPCRDLCISPATPETLISVGYDCLINIFDTRKKISPLKINYCHPISCCAVSNCGLYFCVGNLKGEVTNYDIRNTKECVVTKRIHNCAVTRVLFVPNENEKNLTTSIDTHTINITDQINTQTDAITLDPQKSIVKQRDSFFDFLDFQTNKGQDKISSCLATKRDSFDWEALARKPDSRRGSLLQVNSALTAVNSANNSNTSISSTESKSPNLENVNTTKRGSGLRDRCNTSHQQSSMGKLMQIQEEQTMPNSQYFNCSNCDKENMPLDLELGSRLNKLPDDRNSTPNHGRSSMEAVLSVTANKKAQLKLNTELNSDTIKAITELREEMNSRFYDLEMELKMNADQNKWQMLAQNFNLWKRQAESVDEIHKFLEILLQTDPFVTEFVRLKEENAQLKEELKNSKAK